MGLCTNITKLNAQTTGNSNTAEFEVSYKNLNGIILTENEQLLKTVEEGWGNAYANSNCTMAPFAHGLIEYVPGNTASNYAFGFRDVNDPCSGDLSDFRHCFHFHENQTFTVEENNTIVYGPVPYNSGDIFRIERIGQFMKYEHNANEVAQLAGFLNREVLAEVAIFSEAGLVYKLKASFDCPLKADAGEDKTICMGGSTTIGGSPASLGGKNPISYLWEPAEGLSNSTVAHPTANPLQTTKYILTVIDNQGNSATDLTVVEVVPLTTVSAGDDVSICYGSSVTLTASGADYYSWSPSIGLSTTTEASTTAGPETSTQYKVTGTDPPGCMGEAVVTVTVLNPIANAGNDITIASGTSVQIGSDLEPGVSYSWSPVTGLDNSYISNPVFFLQNNSNSDETFTYTLTASIENCSNADDVNITVTSVIYDAIPVTTVQDTISSLTPGKVFDVIHDNYGNRYSLKDIMVEEPNNSTARISSHTCDAGYFNVVFEPNCGMDIVGNDVHDARRAVICQLLNDISNFIISPCSTNNVKVNIWVRDISKIVTDPHINNVGGLASPFYVAPSGASASGGIIDNEIWKTIISGINSYTNVANPLISSSTNPGAPANYYHGMMAFNFYNPDVNWNTNLTSAQPANFANLIDLYTVALHEFTHALGFASLIDVDGTSILNTGFDYYSRYDLFLQDAKGNSLINNTTGCSIYNNSFNTNVLTSSLAPKCTLPGNLNEGAQINDTYSCTNAIKYNNGSINVPVYNPACFERGGSLSHFEDECIGTNQEDIYYVMSNSVLKGIMKRRYQPEERKVLCDLGYSTNSSFGNDATVINSYRDFNMSCTRNQVVGVNDGITNGIYTFTGATNKDIPITDLLRNDHSADRFECLQVVSRNGTLSATSGDKATVVNFQSATPGLVILKYIPWNNASNIRGNITYIFVFVLYGNCTPEGCNNLINNSGFENSTGCGSYDYYYPTAGLAIDCWTPFGCTPDLFSRQCVSENLKIPTGVGEAYSVNNNYFVGISSNEAIQNTLLLPITKDNTYHIGFWAKISNKPWGSSLNFTADINIGGEVGTVPPICSSPMVPLSNILATLKINYPSTLEWHYYETTLTPYTGNIPITYLVIANAVNNNFVYIFIDDIRLTLIENAGQFHITPSTLCINQTIPDLSVYATPPGGTFSGTGVQLNSGIYSFSATTAGTGTHTIMYSYTDNLGCPVNIGTDVTVSNSTFNTISATASPATICPGQSSVLTAKDASTYLWQPGNLSGSTITVTPSVTTQYTVVGTDVNGCQSDPVAVTVTVSNSALNNVKVTAYPSTICTQGGTSTLTATGASTYLWQPGNLTGSTITVTPSVTTQYTVVGTDANGCQSAPMPATVTVSPLLCPGTNQTICQGETIGIGGEGLRGYTYSWSPSEDLSDATYSNPLASPTTTTTYSVTVTQDATGYTFLHSLTVTVNPTPAASFTFNKYDNIVGTPVNFTNTSSNATGVTYTWDFMDAEGSTTYNGNVATHTFSTYWGSGYYQISLTVANSYCSYKEVQNIYIISSAGDYSPTYDCLNNFPYNYIDLEITSSNQDASTLNSTGGVIYIKGTLTIKAGGKLFVNNKTIAFGPQGKVIVEAGISSTIQGALLRLNAAQLSGIEFSNCNGKNVPMMWQGVEVWGKSSSSSQSDQGQIILLNNSKVEDAYNGVILGKTKLTVTNDIEPFFIPNDHDNNFGGGIIKAISSTFNRCLTGVKFFDYPHYNGSRIVSCNFTCKDVAGNNVSVLDPHLLEPFYYKFYRNPFFGVNSDVNFHGFSLGNSLCNIVLLGIQKAVSIQDNTFDYANVMLN